jgi:hypothetical protein
MSDRDEVAYCETLRCRNRHVMALPNPELGPVSCSANCASSQ